MKAGLLAIVAACGNSLPPPGTCDVPTAGLTAMLEPVALGGPAGYDDLKFAPALGKVVAAPESSGHVFLIDPDTLAVDTVSVPLGVASADASATRVFGVDRFNDQVVAVDIASGARTTGAVAGHPDYVRVAPNGEVWVTVPDRDQIQIFDATSLAPIGSVALSGGPEGLTFDGGRAYTQSGGRVIAIDVAPRVVAAEWDDGCGYSHGFPQVDSTYGLAVGGCFSNGGIGVVSMQGDLRSGIEVGGGEAILALDPVRHHLYVRGDPGDTLDILAVCPDGGLGTLQSIPIPNRGHGATVDDRGHAWLADAATGGVIRIDDPFPGTN